MGMAVKLEFVPLDDGIHSRLTISGGKPGPHRATVRSEPSGLGLAHMTWQHDADAACDIPVEHEFIVVTVDDDHEEHLEVVRNKPWLRAHADAETEEERKAREAQELVASQAKKAPRSKSKRGGSAGAAVEPSTVAPIPDPESKDDTPVPDETQNGPDVPTNAADPRNSSLPAPGVDLPDPPEPDVLPTADGHADSVDPEGNDDASDRQKQPEHRPTKAEEAKAGDAGKKK